MKKPYPHNRGRWPNLNLRKCPLAKFIAARSPDKASPHRRKK